MTLQREGIKDVFTKLGKKYFQVWFSGIQEKGEYKSWYENGQLWMHHFYKNRKLEGDSKTWDEDGTLSRHAIYKDGRVVREII